MRYRAPIWLPGGHAQTIWPALYAKRRRGMALPLQRERWTTPDGDFVDVDRQHASRLDRPLLVLGDAGGWTALLGIALDTAPGSQEWKEFLDTAVDMGATREQAEARLEELLDSALDHFLQHGFELATIDMIATAVNMTKRTVYAKFEDKAGLFLAENSDFALNAHGQLRHASPFGRLEPGVALQVRPQHGQGIVAPKDLPINHETGHPKEVQGQGLVGVVLQGLFDFCAGRIVERCQIGRQSGQPRCIRRLQTTAPDVPENFLAGPAIGLACGITRGGQAQQTQRRKGVAGRQLQRRALCARLPLHLAEVK